MKRAFMAMPGPIHTIDWNRYNTDILTLALKMHQAGETPDYIVCMGSNASFLAKALSRVFEKPLEVLMMGSYASENGKERKIFKTSENMSIVTKMTGKVFICTELSAGKSLKKFSRKLMKMPDVSVKTAALYLKRSAHIIPDYHGPVFAADARVNLPTDLFNKVSLKVIPRHLIEGVPEEKLAEIAKSILATDLPQGLDVIGPSLLNVLSFSKL